MELFQALTNWKQIIEEEERKEYLLELWSTLNRLYSKTIVYPIKSQVYRAFHLTPYNSVKVVIIGQDPYHDGNAEGLAFSCKIKSSPSLGNINSKIPINAFATRTNKSLVKWAEQGVLLLNTILTVEKGIAKSHSELGWQILTGQCINLLALSPHYKVFILWGKDAKEAWNKYGFNSTFNHVIEAEHPAYASYQRRSWNHNDCFNNANNFLVIKQLKLIDWKL